MPTKVGTTAIPAPWMKITQDVQGGELQHPSLGDNGNYADRHDVMIVGSHHAAVDVLRGADDAT